jgi:hypothetical protein
LIVIPNRAAGERRTTIRELREADDVLRQAQGTDLITIRA